MNRPKNKSIGKGRYLIIVHNWYASQSQGFQIIESEHAELERVQLEEAMIFKNHQSQFQNCSTQIVRLYPDRSLMPPEKPPGQRLTFWERLTGRVRPSVTDPTWVSELEWPDPEVKLILSVDGKIVAGYWDYGMFKDFNTHETVHPQYWKYFDGRQR